MANGEGESAFEESLQDVVREALEDVTGSRTQTPWSAQNFNPQGEFGVTVPKTFDEIFVQTGTLRGVIAASDPTSAFYASRRQPSDVPNFNALPTNERRLFEVAAKAIHPLKTGQGYYEDLIQASWDLSTKGIYRSPQQLAYEAYNEGGATGSGGGDGSGLPRTRTSVSITSPEDAEFLVQEAARDMIGRSLTQQEVDKYVSRYRKREREAVTTTTTSPGGTVTEQGVSKETILRDLMQSNPDFGRYQIDTGFMDLFVDSIREGQAIINAGR